MNKTFAIIFGTRPEYLKLKSVIDAFLNQQSICCKVIYVKQHLTIDEHINCLHDILPIEQRNTGDRLCSIGEQILAQLPFYIEDCTHIIVQGDTATAFYSAICAFQLQKKVVHIEAGLRTYDLEKPFPEEAYRQMISRVASVHFTPHADSSKLLLEENVSGEIHTVGNTILDLISSYNLRCSMDNVVMITFHRRENWDKIDILLEGLRKLTKKTPHIKYIWYLHHNPVLQLKVREAIKELPTVELQLPCNHKEFTQRIASSNFLITDSGGVQEEASFLGKHCIVLRASTERSHIPKEYITVLEDYSKLGEVYDMVPIVGLEPCNVYGYGNSAEQIIQKMRGKYVKLKSNVVFTPFLI
jgi:UDP-N-acetylglucosamine 2-epimerase (non-hydrolysing)